MRLKIRALTLILRLRPSFMIQEGEIEFEMIQEGEIEFEVRVSHLGGASLSSSFEFQTAKLHY